MELEQITHEQNLLAPDIDVAVIRNGAQCQGDAICDPWCQHPNLNYHHQASAEDVVGLECISSNV
jgi:hypothetical protein